MKLAYRPDIDGLRAIAVLAVLFFHTNVPWFNGGFVGVDVFFVISGFLITSILLKDINEGNYSLARFYERRIRRIFPALYPVIAFTIIVGSFMLDSITYKSLSESVLGTALFYSNFVFANELGYFDVASMLKPLLHTWSLAVEEQFYIVFPLLLVVINRYFGGRYFFWLLLLATGSFVTSIYGIDHHQQKTFFLVQARAWELLVGALVALNKIPETSSDVFKRVLSFSGIGLILYGIVFYSEATPFPGYNAMAPVFGAAMIIYSGMGGRLLAVNRLLTAKPLVFIGLISYSLYLWHWPIVAFYRYVLFRQITFFDSLGIIVASFVMAFISWRFIEQPFRRNNGLLQSRTRLFALSGFLMIVTSLTAVTIFKLDGMQYRFCKTKNHDAVPEIKQKSVMKVDQGTIDRIGDDNAVPSFLLWGDSHAGSLVQGLAEKGIEYGVSGYSTIKTANIPLIGVNNSLFNDQVISIIKSHPKIKTVILAGIWGAYSNGHRYGNSSIFTLKDSKSSGADQTNTGVMRNGFVRTINQLISLKCKVVIVDDVPDIGVFAPRLFMVKSILLGEDIGKYVPNKNIYKVWNQEYEGIVSAMLPLKDVRVIHLEEMLFDNKGSALLAANNVILYRDADHLSKYGSHFIAPVFDDVFKELSHSR
ncbi:MAG: acyltransferase family protein [Chlorobiaceae bacterium]